MRSLTRHRRPALVAIGAAVVAGAALWVSRASFDVAGTDAAPTRVAMLPSLPELLGLVAIVLLAAAGLAVAVRTNAEGSQRFWEPVSDALLPLFSLTLLFLPYLPWLADWIPALRLLAGPGRTIVWIVVVGQVIWLILPALARRIGARPLTPATSAMIFAVASVCFSPPFVLNLRNIVPGAFRDLWRAIPQLDYTTLSAFLSGSLGLLFDQEYGLVAYAPVLVLAFLGFGTMLRDRSRRKLAAFLLVAACGLIAVPALGAPWWGESEIPGERVVLLLPLLVAPIARLYERLPVGSTRRAGAQFLFLMTSGITLSWLPFADQAPVRQEADGSSSLLVWLSPTWRLWEEMPTFVAASVADASVRLLFWLAAFVAATVIISRQRASTAGRSAIEVTGGAVCLFLGVAAAGAVFLPDAGKPFTPEGRVLFPMLETFDPVARPIAIRCDRMTVIAPHEIPPLFSLSAVPGQRTDRQPVRVVLNARFRLPAGDYTVHLKGSGKAGSAANPAIGLQVGREGRPLETWPLIVRPGAVAQQHFSLPLDAEFVGFRASRAVEQTIAELRLTPVSIVEVRKRYRAPTVLSAASFPAAALFFHDSHVYPEADGFWVKGRATASFTLRKANEADSSLTLAIHSGAAPNVVTVATATSSQRIALVPGVTERLTIPMSEGTAFVPLRITAENGFVPADVGGSRDRRVLGAWVAFIPGDTSRTSAAP